MQTPDIRTMSPNALHTIHINEETTPGKMTNRSITEQQTTHVKRRENHSTAPGKIPNMIQNLDSSTGSQSNQILAPFSSVMMNKKEFTTIDELRKPSTAQGYQDNKPQRSSLDSISQLIQWQDKVSQGFEDVETATEQTRFRKGLFKHQPASEDDQNSQNEYIQPEENLRVDGLREFNEQQKAVEMISVYAAEDEMMPNDLERPV